MIELENPQIESVEEAGTYAKYEAGPLQAGYGVTLGNALRRVLLSSLEGAAVTSIQIRDVYQEFSTIPGVKEDVTQIVLNVKKLRLKSFASHPVQLRLIKSGAGAVQLENVRATALDVRDGTVRVSPKPVAADPTGTSVVEALSLSAAARLDVTNNAFIVDHAPGDPQLDAIRASIIAARNGGAWDGPGITSSLADANRFAVGYADSSAIFTLSTPFISSDGQMRSSSCAESSSVPSEV